jgi:sugar phosphate isomerase/epimerase
MEHYPAHDASSFFEPERQSNMLFGAMNSPLNPIMEEIEAIAGMGFDYIELTMDPPEAHYSQVIENRHNILTALKRHRLDLVCHMPTFVSLADLTDSIRRASLDEVLSSLTEAAALQPLKIVLHPPYISGLGMHVPALARTYAFQSLTAMIEKGMSLGQTLCLENMPPKTGFCSDVAEFGSVFKQFPEIGLTFDIGHAHIDHTRSRSKNRWLKTFSDRLRHLHISDNHGLSDEHLPIGSGTVNFVEFIKTLKQIQYDQTVTLEIFDEDRNQLITSKEKFQKLWNALT